MPKRKIPLALPDISNLPSLPRVPDPVAEPGVTRVTPGLSEFLRGRIFSVNGITSALYLGLSVAILLDPARARRVWLRLQGEKSGHEA